MLYFQKREILNKNPVFVTLYFQYGVEVFFNIYFDGL